jgi:hypothetical protein
MTTQSDLQSWQERKILFTQARQITPNAAKGDCSCQATEAAGGLLLHFDHAQVALGQIVVKLYAQIFQKAEDGFLMLAQAIEQIASGTLFGASLRARWGRRSGRHVIGFIQHMEKGVFPIEHFQRMKLTLALCACLPGGLFHREPQVFEFDRSVGSMFLSLKDQFTQHMHQTKRVVASIQEVGGPGIMDTDACEDRQDANGVQRLLSSALMHLIMRQPRRTGDMLPVALSRQRRPLSGVDSADTASYFTGFHDFWQVPGEPGEPG